MSSREYRAEYQRELAAYRRSRGLCHDCGAAAAGAFRCGRCAAAFNERRNAWASRKRQERRERGRCGECGQERAPGRMQCSGCLREQRRERRRRVSHGLCASCGGFRDRADRVHCARCRATILAAGKRQEATP